MNVNGGRQSDRDTVETLARAQGLDLPDERLETLARTYGDFMTKFAAVWDIDPGDCEPAAITFDDEVRS
jgi:Asp-tRNA(Asn)/Glu-tRNA(Gln) amidotransferase C subunit